MQKHDTACCDLKALFCKGCDARLTVGLQLLTSIGEIERHCDFASFGGSCYGTPVPLVERGFAASTLHREVRSLFREKSPFDQDLLADGYINLDDLIPSVRRTFAIGRLGGCSGVEGLSGPTHLCSCGAEVGTEHSDCNTWLAFAIDMNSAYWKDDERKKDEQVSKLGSAAPT